MYAPSQAMDTVSGGKFSTVLAIIMCGLVGTFYTTLVRFKSQPYYILHYSLYITAFTLQLLHYENFALLGRNKSCSLDRRISGSHYADRNSINHN